MRGLTFALANFLFWLTVPQDDALHSTPDRSATCPVDRWPVRCREAQADGKGDWAGSLGWDQAAPACGLARNAPARGAGRRGLICLGQIRQGKGCGAISQKLAFAGRDIPAIFRYDGFAGRPLG